MDRQSAEQWNARHLNGTRDSVILRNGETIAAQTATHAQLWGELALVTLVGVEGLWTTSALYADKLACLPPAQTAVDYCSTQTECSG